MPFGEEKNEKVVMSPGARLKKRREEFGMSLEDLTREIQSPPDFISSLEKDDYKGLPAKVYALGFLKKALNALRFEDREKIINQFCLRWDEAKTMDAREERAEKRIFRKHIFTSSRVGLLGLAAFLIFLGFFFGVRLSGFVLPPKLAISEPKDKILSDTPFVYAKGVTEKESRLSVNGRELKIDENGRFDEKIELLRGFNRLEFYVQNRFGKINKAARYIVVK